MYKLALLAGIGAAWIGTPAFADVSDLSTLYIYQAGGLPGGAIMTTPGMSSANGKTASGFPTPSGPEVSVTGSGTQTLSLSGFDDAHAESSWNVRIEGPSETDMIVPILITGSYSATASGTGTAFAGIGTGGELGLAGSIAFAVGGEFTCSPTLDPSGCGSGAFVLSASADDSPLNDHTFSTFIEANGSLNGSPGPFGSFSAFVDPRMSPSIAPRPRSPIAALTAWWWRLTPSPRRAAFLSPASGR